MRGTLSSPLTSSPGAKHLPEPDPRPCSAGSGPLCHQGLSWRGLAAGQPWLPLLDPLCPLWSRTAAALLARWAPGSQSSAEPPACAAPDRKVLAVQLSGGSRFTFVVLSGCCSCDLK